MTTATERRRTRWDTLDEQMLCRMAARGHGLGDIASALDRTRDGCRCKLDEILSRDIHHLPPHSAVEIEQIRHRRETT